MSIGVRRFVEVSLTPGLTSGQYNAVFFSRDDPLYNYSSSYNINLNVWITNEAHDEIFDVDCRQRDSLTRLFIFDLKIANL